MVPLVRCRALEEPLLVVLVHVLGDVEADDAVLDEELGQQDLLLHEFLLDLLKEAVEEQLERQELALGLVEHAAWEVLRLVLHQDRLHVVLDVDEHVNVLIKLLEVLESHDVRPHVVKVVV